MKLVGKVATGVLGLLLVASAFAASTNKGRLILGNAAQLKGQSLKAGTYELMWEGDGNVQLSIKQGRKVIATVPAQVVQLGEKSSNDAAILHVNSDGSRSISQIQFSGKNFALTIEGEMVPAQEKQDKSNQ